MISASVGHQCPECVAEGNKSVRQARTQFGGAISTSSPGLVTRILIGLNVAIFLVQQLVGDKVTDHYALFPIAIAHGQYYRLITAGFLHASFFHILFNMAALWFLGTPLEGLVGRARYLLIYGLALLGGSVASFCFSPVNTLGVGASGAIFGLMGAFAVVAWRQKWDLRPFAVLIGINFVYGFLVPNVDWRAHLGGLVVGAIVGAAIVVPSRERRRVVLAATSVAVLVVLAAMTIWRVNDLQPLVQQYLQLYRLP